MRHQVRCDPLMLAGEHLAGATESGGHFIGDQQDIVLGAELTHSFQIALGLGDHACGRLHQRFDDEAGQLTVPRSRKICSIGSRQAIWHEGIGQSRAGNDNNRAGRLRRVGNSKDLNRA